MNGRIRTNLILKIWKALSAEFVEGKIRLKNYFLELIRKLFDTQKPLLLYGFILCLLCRPFHQTVKPPAR